MVPSAARGLWDWPPLNPQMGRDFVNKWEEGSVRCPQRWEPGSVAWSVASAASTQLSFGDFLLRDLCSPALPEPDPPPPLTMGSMHFVLAVPSLICVKLCRLWCCCWPWHAPAQLTLTLLHRLLLSTTPRSHSSLLIQSRQPTLATLCMASATWMPGLVDYPFQFLLTLPLLCPLLGSLVRPLVARVWTPGDTI